MNINELTKSNNFKILSQRAHGEWVEADSAGNLHLISGALQKQWFAIRNYMAGDRLIADTARAINAICKPFFDEISHSPFNSDAPSLLENRDAIKQLAGSVSTMPNSLCDPLFSKNLKDLSISPTIAEARLALEKGVAPQPLNKGISGSYILKNRNNQPWAIFKPKEKEPGMKGNEHGYDDFSCQGVKPGTGYKREEAAYLLDHQHFSDVPLTLVAKLPSHLVYNETPDKSRPIKGSFQRFVPNCKPGAGFLDTDLILPHEIHKMAILDIRLLNSDRHQNNFIVDARGHIYPIDHGWTIPDNAKHLRFEWMDFDQSKQPFSKEDLAYIEQLDPAADAKLLKEKMPKISEDALLRIEAAGHLLKKAAKRGLTAYQIGDMMQGRHFATSSFELKIGERAAHGHREELIDNAIELYLRKTPI